MIRRVFTQLLLVLSLMFMAAGAAHAEEYKAGEDYLMITPAQPGGANGKVQVVEMFWYGCPHCYEFDPMVDKWLENKPDYVEFIRIPAIFNNKRWSLHAKAFYTAELLGVGEKFHTPFFDAIHRGGQRMNTPEAIKAFFAKFGVDGDTFDETFDSFAVQSKVRRAADLTKKYGIKGVPSMVINGKYQTGGRQSRTYPRMLKITDALIAREAARKNN